MQVAFSCFFQDFIDQGQKPGRYSRQAANVFFDCRLAYPFEFFLPVAHQHDRDIRCFHEVCPKRSVGDQNGREVSVLAVTICRADLAASA